MMGCHISLYGRVQGIGFRNWTVSLAREFRINGWVRNTEDYNCVELVVEGKSEKVINEFMQVLKTEHPYAKVDRCVVSKIAVLGYKGFRVVR